MTGKTYKPYGDVEMLWYEHPAECCLVGPAGTGKSRGIGEFLLWALLEFPGSRALAMRKTRVSMSQSWLVTWEDKVLAADVDATYLEVPLLEARQKEGRPSYKFKNGSELVLGGMDQPTRLFSTEYDIAYVNECNELTEGEWESLHRALRNNKMPFQRLIGDMNPDAPTHWMRRRMNEGRTKEYVVLHKDNPSLTPEYLTRLSRLTGTRRARLYEGRWVAAEGQIWENFNHGPPHLIDKVPLLTGGRSVIMWKIASVDWGFRNPGCIQVWGVDNDNRMYLLEEVYFVEKTIDWWVQKARELFRRHQLRVFVCDPAEPGFIHQFRQAGLPTREANNDVLVGLDTVRNRLDLQPDGRPALAVLRGCTRPLDERLRELQRPVGLLEEIPGYVWKKVEADKYGKEEPDPNVAQHACDCARYAAMYLDRYGYADDDEDQQYRKGTMGDIMKHEDVWEWSKEHEATYGRDWLMRLN